MEKSGQQHQEESDQVAEQIASDFCTWLRALPKGETENINYTSPDYIRQLFDERVRCNEIHQEYYCLNALHIVYKINLYFPVISRMMQTIIGVDGIQLLVKELRHG